MTTKDFIREFVELFKDDVIQSCEMKYGENLVLASGCDNYGCNCISYEICQCGCLLQ